MRARKVALISNARVFALYGAAAMEALRQAEFDVMPWLMGEERYKSVNYRARARFLRRALSEAMR
ncbi:MAG: hypothetical protein WKF30_09135 [Pyrinomonadaceae bacterium]